MTTTWKHLTLTDHDADLHEPEFASSPCSIKFGAEHDRLLKEIEESGQQFEIEQEVRKAAAQRKRSIELFDPVEDWLYSLIAAAAIFALLLGVLWLPDFSTSRAGAAVASQSQAIERHLPSQGKDGKF
jgi:hypothetical protein